MSETHSVAAGGSHLASLGGRGAVGVWVAQIDQTGPDFMSDMTLDNLIKI
jgi:hypothetical protein